MLKESLKVCAATKRSLAMSQCHLHIYVAANLLFTSTLQDQEISHLIIYQYIPDVLVTHSSKLNKRSVCVNSVNFSHIFILSWDDILKLKHGCKAVL